MDKRFFVFIVFLILLSSCGVASALKETQLSTNKADQWNPSIWNNYIVWQDARNGGSDVYLTDMKTKVQTRITKGVDAENPMVSGTKIVWSDNRNGNWDVYMYDISKKKTTRITTNKADQTHPASYGNVIVWDDTRNGDGSDIYMLDLSTKKETRITKNGESWNPCIYDTKIVYENLTFDGISMYDTKTKKTVPVEGLGSAGPNIYGTKIVYLNNYNMPVTVLYDFSKKTWTDLQWLDNPAIYSNKIIYTDYRNGNGDIFMTQI